MKTYSPKPEHIERRWYVIDARGQVLGRVASEAALVLRGKHKPIFAPHMDTGDHVVIVNAEKVELTGEKEAKKIAYRHSGYPGGIKGVNYADLLSSRPEAAVERAVRGMLPKNRLGRQMIKKLHVVRGSEHPHQAQQPVAWQLGSRPAWRGLPQPATAAELPEKGAPKTHSAPRGAATKISATKKPTAKRSAAKQTTAKKSTASRTTAKSTSAKRATAKRSTAKRSTAKRASSSAGQGKE
jgi:large subunit ribosomal protein L13